MAACKHIAVHFLQYPSIVCPCSSPELISQLNSTRLFLASRAESSSVDSLNYEKTSMHVLFEFHLPMRARVSPIIVWLTLRNLFTCMVYLLLGVANCISVLMHPWSDCCWHDLHDPLMHACPLLRYGGRLAATPMQHVHIHMSLLFVSL